MLPRFHVSIPQYLFPMQSGPWSTPICIPLRNTYFLLDFLAWLQHKCGTVDQDQPEQKIKEF